MKKLLLLIIAIMPLMAMAQGEAAWWFFGENASLDFNTAAPVTGPVGSLSTIEGCSTISDSCGNLLFYSDGSTVWDNAGNPMPNGTGLSGNSTASQSAIIIPDLQNSNLYIIITVYTNVKYSVVDMSLNGGLGDVVSNQKNISIAGNTQEKIAAVKNAAGDGYWIILTKSNGRIESYPATNGMVSGGNANRVRSPNVPGIDMDDFIGQIKVSPDGTKFGFTGLDNGAVVFDYDTATGLATNAVKLGGPNIASVHTYGIEFSPNSELVYVNYNSNSINNLPVTNNIKRLYQYNTAGAAGWENNPVEISVETGEGRGALQLGIDEKIYHARTFTQNLGVVNDPNVVGTGANYVHNGVTLPATMQVREGLPPFVSSFFELDVTAFDGDRFTSSLGNEATTFCLGTNVQFESGYEELCSTSNVLWDFGDSTTSTDFSPQHAYGVAGSYTVTLTVTAFGYTTVDDQVITIEDSAVANVVPTVVLCDDDQDGMESRDLTVVENGIILGAQVAADNLISYHLSQADADANQAALTMPYNFPTGTTTLYVRITKDPAPNACVGTSTFDVVVKNRPTYAAQTNIEVCDVDNDGFSAFDLTVYEAILNGGNPADFAFAYYTSQADAFADANAISTPTDFTNTAVDSQTIFIKVIDLNAPGCDGVSQFNVVVNDTPVVGTIATQVLCDDDGNGTEDVDLSQFNTQVLNGQAAGAFVVTYYDNNIDAAAGTNAITTINVGLGTTTVFTRVNGNDCFGTGSFDIQLSETPVIGVATSITNICDENIAVGQNSFDLSVQDDQLYNGYNTSDFTLTYHATQADADTNTNPLSSIYSIPNPSGNSSILYARLENNAGGCYDVSSFEIIFESCEVIFPEGFSPNNDGVNDTFSIPGLQAQFPNFVLKIYNRAGAELYETRSENYVEFAGIPNKGLFASDGLLPVGTYFYVIQYNDPSQEDTASWVYINY
ncbi:MAG: gliding motility-associated C-terminal domain-containing protein [Nonlabens sp.]|uniref:T9SS type B sorting domain-containing protein n=1 Tax=Nonlabens sp. TaxID=1888209 RepID=UPI003EF6614D